LHKKIVDIYLAMAIMKAITMMKNGCIKQPSLREPPVGERRMRGIRRITSEYRPETQ